MTPFPHAEADTLDGAHLIFPDSTMGKPAVFIVAVDRASSANLREWAKRLCAGVGDTAPVLSVVVADGAPFFVKGAIKKALEKDPAVPCAGQHSRTLLTFKRTGWQTVIDDGKSDEPEIVIVDSAGKVVYAKRSAPNDTVLNEALTALPLR